MLRSETIVYGITCEVCKQKRIKGRRIRPLGYLHDHLVCTDCERDIKAAEDEKKRLLLRVARAMGKKCKRS